MSRRVPRRSQREPEAARHHAYDGAGCSIESHSRTDHRLIAAELPPQAKAQYCDRLAAWHIVACTEGAAEKGARAEYLEEFSGSVDTTDEARWSLAVAEHHVSLTVERYLAEAGHASTDVKVFLVVPVCLFPEDTNLVLVAEG
jgi:hypothetical protein